MSSTNKECRYCFASFSSSTYPILLSCHCIVCNHCLKYFKTHPNPNSSQCLLCKATINLSKASKYEALLSAIQEDNFIEQELIKKYNQELIDKSKYCSSFISHSGLMLENLKKVEIFYIYTKHFKSSEQKFKGINDRLDFVKRFSLLNNQRFDVKVSKRIVMFYLGKLFRVVYEFLLLYEIFQVSQPWMTIWMGSQIVRLIDERNREVDSVFIRNNSSCDVAVRALGFFLGIDGNLKMRQGNYGSVQVIEIAFGQKNGVFEKDVVLASDPNLRFTCEVELEGFVMKRGAKYQFVWMTGFENQISMFYEEVLQFGEIRLEVTAEVRKGPLAFLKCEPVEE